MIEPTYATFEQSKFFKEKGFDNVCSNYYHIRGKLMNLENGDTGEWECDAPEQWQVVEWLRVNHNIEMWVAPFIYEGFFETPRTYSYFIYSEAGWENDGVDFESPQEAYSAAFDYIKNNNLI
jgi:hypothetical protein